MGSYGRVTIRDVAKAAGVSPATVSRSLSQPGRVNAQTASHVRKVAKDLGYYAESVNVRDDDALKGTIMTVTPGLQLSVFTEFIYGMQTVCLSKDFCLITSITNDQSGMERAIIKRLEPHIDGLILPAPRLSNVSLHKASQIIPTVMINRVAEGIPSVVCDEHDAIDAAVRRLHELGHTSLTYLAGPKDSWQNGVRWQTLQSVCRAIGMRVRHTEPRSPIRKAELAVTFQEFLHTPTTAVITFNDGMAIRLMKYLAARNIDVPRQVSIISIDNDPESKRTDPPLSCISIPRYEMGAAAARLLIGRILHTTSGTPSPVIMNASFIERDSIGPARNPDDHRP